MEFLWTLEVKSINQLWINQQKFTYMDFRFCHSTQPIKETWISVRTVHNKSLISANKVDPLKKAAHKSNWTVGLSTLWLEGCCGLNTHLPGLHTKEIQAFSFILCTCACGWNEDVWKESNLKQVFVPLLVSFAQWLMQFSDRWSFSLSSPK